jgi:hypothetical protein
MTGTVIREVLPVTTLIKLVAKKTAIRTISFGVDTKRSYQRSTLVDWRFKRLGIANHVRVFGSVFPHEHSIADQAFTHPLSANDKHFASLVTAVRVRASSSFLVGRHVDQQ